MNLFKKILKLMGLALGVFLLGWILILAWYYPHYKSNQEVITFETPANEEEIRIMNYNVRCPSPFDLGKKSWYYRADLIAESIETAAPTIIGFQEVTKWQYEYIVESLVDFDSIITYRDEVINSEGCPIFYRTDLYTLIDKGSFWLSETPDVMSKDWGAAHYRICSYVILKDNASKNEFVVFNAHLDHVSDEARINGIQVVLDKIKEFDSRPAILMGDLNAEESTETYKSATESFLDAKYVTDNTMTSCTFQGWGEELDRDCIDYIMISPDSFEVDFYKVITDTYDGVYSSDHFPLLVSLKLR
ncbi:MAG: endonuclease/exonuclease/phosphatase family protein [Agathobacter sp.]|nr:endonuclease/exonuclease/phosphatase family protein [Agathobacter sp.]